MSIDFMEKGIIFDFVIDTLMKEKGMKRSEAMRTWYGSETKRLVFDSGLEEFDYISRTRVYSELIMELEGNSYWMCAPLD